MYGETSALVTSKFSSAAYLGSGCFSVAWHGRDALQMRATIEVGHVGVLHVLRRDHSGREHHSDSDRVFDRVRSEGEALHPLAG